MGNRQSGGIVTRLQEPNVLYIDDGDVEEFGIHLEKIVLAQTETYWAVLDYYYYGSKGV
jgi:hypothetical protein